MPYVGSEGGWNSAQEHLPRTLKALIIAQLVSPAYWAHCPRDRLPSRIHPGNRGAEGRPWHAPCPPPRPGSPTCSASSSLSWNHPHPFSWANLTLIHQFLRTWFSTWKANIRNRRWGHLHLQIFWTLNGPWLCQYIIQQLKWNGDTPWNMQLAKTNTRGK